MVALVGTALVSCSSNDDAASSSSSSGGGAFPVTIDHAFGSTTIDSEPQRIVTVGYNDEQALLGSGHQARRNGQPVPGRTGRQPHVAMGHRPLGRNRTDRRRQQSRTTISVEKIAALEPDLILALYSSIDKDLYSTLSAIAPTVAKDPAYGDYATPWQITTKTAAKAVGREADGEKLVADIDKQFADARSAHPEFADQTAVIISVDATPEFYAFSSEDARGRGSRQSRIQTCSRGRGLDERLSSTRRSPPNDWIFSTWTVSLSSAIPMPHRRSETTLASSNSTWSRTIASSTSTTIRPRRSVRP